MEGGNPTIMRLLQVKGLLFQRRILTPQWEANHATRMDPIVNIASKGATQTDFSDTCKSHTQLCVSPTLHPAIRIPDSFAGAALDMARPYCCDYSYNMCGFMCKTLQELK